MQQQQQQQPQQQLGRLQEPKLLEVGQQGQMEQGQQQQRPKQGRLQSQAVFQGATLLLRAQPE
jgi:hypothetical protein